MTSKKILNKEMEVIAGISGTPIGTQLKTAEGICDAIIANPTVATVTPTALSVKTKIAGILLLEIEKTDYMKKVNSITEQINAETREVRVTINSQWCSQVQATPGITAADVLLIGMKIKGEGAGGVEAKVVNKASESNPLISKIESNLHMKHKIHIINSAKGNKGIPPDASACIVYMQIGGTTLPTDIDKMTYVGKISNGSITRDFKPEDVGKIVYYIAVYIDLKTDEPMIYSPVASALIN